MIAFTVVETVTTTITRPLELAEADFESALVDAGYDAREPGERWDDYANRMYRDVTNEDLAKVFAATPVDSEEVIDRDYDINFDGCDLDICDECDKPLTECKCCENCGLAACECNPGD